MYARLVSTRHDALLTETLHYLRTHQADPDFPTSSPSNCPSPLASLLTYSVSPDMTHAANSTFAGSYQIVAVTRSGLLRC